MMANIVQNSISDLTQFGFVSWRLWVTGARDKREAEWNTQRANQLVDELGAVKQPASMSKAEVALKRLKFGKAVVAFSGWKSTMQLMKRLREIEAKAPLAKLKDIEGNDEKLRFMLARWSLTDAARALKQWSRCVRADSIESILVAEQRVAHAYVADQRFRVIVRQWKGASQAAAVGSWRQKTLEHGISQAVTAGQAAKNKHNYEVLCKRILRLDNTIFTNHVGAILTWCRTELRRGFGVWLTGHLSSSHRVWDMRSSLQKLRTKAAGSFVKLLDTVSWRVRTGLMQKAWGLWRSFMVHAMVGMHQAMVEKLWGRNQSQAAEMDAMRQEVQFGRSLGSTIEENQDLKRSNQELMHRNNQILAHSDEVGSGAVHRFQELVQECQQWKAKALGLETECAGLQDATLEEQSDFLELFARQAERMVKEREVSLRSLILCYGRMAVAAGFLNWSQIVLRRQLGQSMNLVNAGNAQIRNVIAKVGEDQVQVPRLQQQLQESNRERDELRDTVERNMQHTQALISNLNYLKAALPSHVQAPGPHHSTNSRSSVRSSPGGSRAGSAVSIDDLLSTKLSAKSIY